MITEQIGSHFVFIQGFRRAHVADSERLLRDLRTVVSRVELQLLRADRVAGKEHLIFAARNAVDSFKGRDRKARHLSMELLLYASGEHQIIEAIKLLGVSPSTTDLVVVGLSETKPDLEQLQDIIVKTVNAAPDDTVIDIERPNRKNDLKKAYKISDRELNSSRMPGETESEVLKKLVIERSALLALEH